MNCDGFQPLCWFMFYILWIKHQQRASYFFYVEDFESVSNDGSPSWTHWITFNSIKHFLIYRTSQATHLIIELTLRNVWIWQVSQISCNIKRPNKYYVRLLLGSVHIHVQFKNIRIPLEVIKVYSICILRRFLQICCDNYMILQNFASHSPRVIAHLQRVNLIIK